MIQFSACKKEENYPQSLFFYPEAFTPNGDGLNDYWIPLGCILPSNDSIAVWQVGINLDTYEIKISNKNGRQLFKSEDINIPWDGTFKKDTCTEGFYYYLTRYESLDGIKYRDAGVFELIR